jgi:AcrR family transcriptional regulator
MKTREKILTAAVPLFNQYGLPNVGLQQIADECGISVGNLAYHFQYKKDLMGTIANKINAEISPVVDVDLKFPLLIDFDNQLSRYYALINKFAFFFLDVIELERSYPKIHQQRVKYIKRMIGQVNHWISGNVEKGIFKPAIHTNQYAHTAHAIWMIISFWLTQKKVLSSKGPDEEKFKIIVWNQLLSGFTDVGLMEYEALILPQLREMELVRN